MSKKLFIPQVGDEIILAEDWTFNLQYEWRNIKCAEYFGFRSEGGWYVKSDDPLKTPTFPYATPSEEKAKFEPFNVLDKINPFKRSKQLPIISKELDEAQKKYNQERKKYLDYLELFGRKSLLITLPKGTKLKVDRVYIRKNAKDFSSLTFFASIGGKKIRFWASLEDCNKIIFGN